jgi:phosphoribosyl-ATP pyrophosphohydrolase/phosphoribosyl-AMP cyclohydrolase/histidinol dehydrogenase
MLRRISPSEVHAARASCVDSETLSAAHAIVNDVRLRDKKGLLDQAVRLGDLPSKDAPFLIDRSELENAFNNIPVSQQELLQRTANRIRRFAQAQLDSLDSTMSITVPGGKAGHSVIPVESAGCYCPGGRYPLPSTVLMTAVTARVAGVKRVVVASPRPAPITLAAAYVAQADQVLAIGGAQAIATLAYGLPMEHWPAVDVIVGPGNRWVTAAKQLVSGAAVRIDMLAGPSELVVVADESVPPALVASDLLAQAEHDVDAVPILIAIQSSHLWIERVNEALRDQLADLPTKETAAKSVANNGLLIHCESIEQAADMINQLAPEHLEILIPDPHRIIPMCNHYGSVFIGVGSAEVMGDYGAGPNHTLPTGGTARHRGGLSVFDFLRIRTWLDLDVQTFDKQMMEDAAALARLEGLVGHERSALARGRMIPLETKQDIAVSHDCSRLLRDDFESLPLYEPVEPIEILAHRHGLKKDQLVKLDANENMYGPSDQVKQALSTACSDVHIYPDPNATAMKQALIHHHEGLHLDQIVCGAGADDMLDLILRIAHPQEVLWCPPSFGMYPFLSKVNAVPQLISITRGPAPNFSIDVDAIVTHLQQSDRMSKRSVVFIASPNNPTGGLIGSVVLDRILNASTRALVVIDEAYIDFAPASASFISRVVHECPLNLIVTRTLSKWAGLAGLRAGYLVGHPEIVSRINSIKQPYNVNVLAEKAAVAALQFYPTIARPQIMKLVSERHRLYRILSHSSSRLQPVPSAANFVLCTLKPGWHGSIERLQACLARRGIMTRRYGKQYLRISAGRPRDTDALIQALVEEGMLGVGENCQWSTWILQPRLPILLWDLDGVLADVSASYRKAIIQTASSFGVELSDDDITDAKRLGKANNDWELTYRLVRNAREGGPTLQQIIDRFQQLYLGGLREHEKLLIDSNLLHTFADQFRMGIVTGRPRDEAHWFLDRYKLGDLFEVVICQEDGLAKPAPDLVDLALQRMHVTSTDPVAYFIGDTIDDIQAALSSQFGVIPVGYQNLFMKEACGTALMDAGAVRLYSDFNEMASEFGIPSCSVSGHRQGHICRKTKETDIDVGISLDGSGIATIATGIGFLDHMLETLSKHSRIDLTLRCQGDLYVDDHHTAEDCALALGQAIDQALGDRKGLKRFGSDYAPLDEALARAVVDISGRPCAQVDLKLKRPMIGTISGEMLQHVISSLAIGMRATIHVDVLKGTNDHHKAEASFKALALALRSSVSTTAFTDIPSTKGVL